MTSLSAKPVLEVTSNKNEKLLKDSGEDYSDLEGSSAYFLSESCFVCLLSLFCYILLQ